jgi:hypothetical protein
LELSVVSLEAILGPELVQNFGNSGNLVIKAMDGSMPVFCPKSNLMWLPNEENPHSR